MNVEISRELFIQSMAALQRQNEIDRECSKAFAVILPNDYVSGYNNNLVTSQLLKILQMGMNDLHRDSWIQYFAYEIEFGRAYKDGCATHLSGEPIDLSDAGKLWDFLAGE